MSEASVLVENLYVIYTHGQIEKNDMGGACSTYASEERCLQDFGGET